MLLGQGCNTIVKFYGYSIAPPMVSIIMQYCQLGSLRDVLNKKDTADELEYKHRLELAADTARAVAHLHAIGFVHRDIKSLNVMCTCECPDKIDQASITGHSRPIWACLGDFGETVTVEESRNETPRQHGTLAYQAPEIFLNWRVSAQKKDHEGKLIKGTNYMPEADCYSLSIVLWECCTTLQPFMDVMHPVKRKPLMLVDQYQLGDCIAEEGVRPSLQSVSPQMNVVLERGWHPDSVQRLTALQIEHSIINEISGKRMSDSGTTGGILSPPITDELATVFTVGPRGGILVV